MNVEGIVAQVTCCILLKLYLAAFTYLLLVLITMLRLHIPRGFSAYNSAIQKGYFSSLLILLGLSLMAASAYDAVRPDVSTNRSTSLKPLSSAHNAVSSPSWQRGGGGQNTTPHDFISPPSTVIAFGTPSPPLITTRSLSNPPAKWSSNSMARPCLPPGSWSRSWRRSSPTSSFSLTSQRANRRPRSTRSYSPSERSLLWTMTGSSCSKAGLSANTLPGMSASSIYSRIQYMGLAV